MHALTLPRLGQTMMAGRIVEWFLTEGAQYAEGEVIYSIETDKSILEVTATLPGTLLRRLAKADDEVPVGRLVGVSADPGESCGESDIERFITARTASAEAARDSTAVGSETEQAAPPAAEAAEVSAPRAMPRAKRLARELGIDLATIGQGSGADGLITEKDVQSAADARTAQQSTAKAASASATRVRTLSAIEQSIARQMTRSWQVPQFSQDIEIDAEALLQKRRRLQAQGQSVSMTALLLDALVSATRAVPRCNATFDGEQLIESDAVDAGVAAATPRGLLVPVLRGCDSLDLARRNEQLAALFARAKDGTLRPEELTGGTITLSNLGASRVETGMPIINAPQVCLVFTGAVVEKPVVRKGALAVGKRMHVVCVYDHRVIDGTTGARFVDALASALTSD